jgi:hypothetical protein
MRLRVLVDEMRLAMAARSWHQFARSLFLEPATGHGYTASETMSSNAPCVMAAGAFAA